MGVILLVIVAYVVVSGTLFAGETMANTQKDITLLQEARLRTALSLTDLVNSTSQPYIVSANITNTGTEIIGDFKHMDVLVYDNEDGVYEVCSYNQDLDTRGHWKITDYYGEFIHPGELDPGEVYQIQITTVANVPKWFQITTANGVYASGFKK